MDDHELLREYVRSRSQDAFRQLVERHLPMVFAAARRMVGDAQLAQEVAQAVFTTLDQKADLLGESTIVGGWLYNTTRHLAMHTVRTEQRRRQREKAVAVMQSLETDYGLEPILERLEPAMAELEEGERATLVLRYFEDRSLCEVGRELGISEDAARMRVNRALERLRTVFANQGVTIASVLLVTTMAASTTTALPLGLVATITATVLTNTATPALAQTSAALNTMLKAKIVALLLGVALLTGTGTYLVQHRKLQVLQADNQRLLALQAQASAEQQEAAVKEALVAKDELSRLRTDNADLLRLRNEVGQLRRDRDAQKQQTSRPLPVPGPGANNPGRYISKDQLANIGYATPEAALESITWALLNGTYEQAGEGLAPDLLRAEVQDAKGREQFEANQKRMAASFKGIQTVAQKALGEDRVELKIKMDFDSLPNGQPSFLIQPLVRVGEQWKISGSTRACEPTWDDNGQVQSFAQ